MSKVDRSYSKYKSIREYVCRGKMKWNPFATAELNSAHREYKISMNQEMFEELELVEKKYRISQCLNTNMNVVIKLKCGSDLFGIITDVLENDIVVLKNDDKYIPIGLEEMISIENNKEEILLGGEFDERFE